MKINRGGKRRGRKEVIKIKRKSITAVKFGELVFANNL